MSDTRGCSDHPTLNMLIGTLSTIHDRYSYTGFLASTTHVVLAALKRKKKICGAAGQQVREVAQVRTVMMAWLMNVVAQL
jgi:hypothetical protein